MKYYVYISRTKLDMLYEQIEVLEEKKREAFIGFDIKLIKGEIKESYQITSSIYAKLTHVLNYLEDSKLSKTINNHHSPYIRGICNMIWTTYGWKNPNITLWAYNKNKNVLALVGSRFHILGEKRGEGCIESLSNITAIHNAIEDWIHQNVSEPFSKEELGKVEEKDRELNNSYDIADGIRTVVKCATGQQSKFEFVAKVLHRSQWPPDAFRDGTRHITLASPLYVSLK